MKRFVSLSFGLAAAVAFGTVCADDQAQKPAQPLSLAEIVNDEIPAQQAAASIPAPVPAPYPYAYQPDVERTAVDGGRQRPRLGDRFRARGWGQVPANAAPGYRGQPLPAGINTAVGYANAPANPPLSAGQQVYYHPSPLKNFLTLIYAPRPYIGYDPYFQERQVLPPYPMPPNPR